MISFTLNGSFKERLSVTVLGYERGITGDYDDDNWLVAVVEVRVGGFSGEFGATFLTGDFTDFLEQLQRVYESLSGEAVFSTLEEQLSFRVSATPLGGIIVTGIALDRPGNELQFEFALEDQTWLVPVLKELKEIVRQFPIRGA